MMILRMNVCMMEERMDACYTVKWRHAQFIGLGSVV